MVSDEELDPKTRTLWMAVRQALIIVIRAIDRYLCREPTIPERKR
jgi:hypothetical protein